MAQRDDRQREQVLQDFIEAHPRPTVDAIAEWVTRHPDFAADIRLRAETALQVAQTADPTAVPSSDLAKRSRALAAKHLRAAFAARPKELWNTLPGPEDP